MIIEFYILVGICLTLFITVAESTLFLVVSGTCIRGTNWSPPVPLFISNWCYTCYCLGNNLSSCRAQVKFPVVGGTKPEDVTCPGFTVTYRPLPPLRPLPVTFLPPLITTRIIPSSSLPSTPSIPSSTLPPITLPPITLPPITLPPAPPNTSPPVTTVTGSTIVVTLPPQSTPPPPSVTTTSTGVPPIPLPGR